MRLIGRGAPVDWLLVGLGNPGRRYEGTRHNVGFMVADALAARWQLGRARKRFRGRVAEGRFATHGAPRVAMLWPETYMNDAGRSVGPARGFFKVPFERLLVIHDEIDLPFGELRTRRGGGIAGHNGLRSLKHALGGADFWRARMGVGRPASTDPEIVAAYVLAPFTETEVELRAFIERGCDAVEGVILAEHGS